MVEDFGDYHNDVEILKVRPKSEHTQSAGQAKENPFLRKVLKLSSICKIRDFRDLGKSPRLHAKTLQIENLKNFAKCFSRLEGLLVRESRAEPRKSLCNHRDWTFYS